MAETVFPKPLDQEVAGLNAHLENYAKECQWVTGSISAVGNTKAANYPTGYTFTDCYLDAAYYYFSGSNEYYPVPNGVATVILKSDGIYVSTQQSSFVGSYSFLLRKI